jgi:hypothetical protein
MVLVRCKSTASAWAWAEGGRFTQAWRPALGTPRTRAMRAIGNAARFALMHRKTRAGSRRSRERTIGLRPIRLQSSARPRRARGRSSGEEVALLAPRLVLAAQPGKFLTLGHGRRAVGSRGLRLPAAFGQVGLQDPVADRLRGRLELAGQVGRVTPGADQLDPLAPGLRRLGWTCLGHG